MRCAGNERPPLEAPGRTARPGRRYENGRAHADVSASVILHRAARCLLCLSLIVCVGGCASEIGAGVLVGVVAIGVATSRCYDYLDVTVFDSQGRKTCSATVTARSGDDRLELHSCYYAALSEGVWTLRAESSTGSAESTVKVDHADGCTRNVQTVELTLK